MKTTSEILQDALLQGKHLTKFDFLNLTNSVCLAQRVLELRQLGWNVKDKAVKGKGNLREYYLEPEEIERLKNTQSVAKFEQKRSDDQLLMENRNLAEMASESLKNEEEAYFGEQLGIGLLGGKNYG